MAGHQRNFGLDLLRCAAIAMVLANHAFLAFFVELGDVPWTGLRAALSIVSFISIEWLFVLSGFLIGTMMIRSFDLEPTWWRRTRSFWLRRWFRTLPNYYLFLLVNALIFWWGATPLPIGRFQWRFVAFAQNLAWHERLPFFFNEAWSLALDEWFYLVLPLLVGLAFVLASRRDTRRAFLAGTAILILVPTLLRLLRPVPPDNYAWDLEVRRVTLFHLDATGWGVLAAVLNRWHPDAWNRHVGRKAAAGALLMALGILGAEELFFGGLPLAGRTVPVLTAWPPFAPVFLLTLTGLGTFLAFPWIALRKAPAGLARKAVEHVSNYTYSIYLSHFPVLFVVTGLLNRGEDGVPLGQLWLEALLWLLLTAAVAVTVHHTFEKPVSDLRDRFTRKVDASPFGNPATPP